MHAAFILFLASISLGTRKLLYQFTPGFHEYEAAFLYLSDIFLILFLAVYAVQVQKSRKSKIQIPNVKSNPKSQFPKLHVTCLMSLVTFLFFAFLSVFFAYSKLLALYGFARLVLVALMAFAVAAVVREKPRLFRVALAIIAVVAVLQSLIGFFQFRAQENIGLKWLGESPISVTDGKTSKILIEGVLVLRAYGLFPHPNILGAFLIMGLLSLCYFYLRADTRLYSVIPDRDRAKALLDVARRIILFEWHRELPSLDSRLRGNDKKGRMTRWRDFNEWWRRGKIFFYRRIAIAAAIFIILLGLTLTFSRAAWLSAVVGITFLIVTQALATKYENSTNIRKVFRIKPIFRLLFLLVASGYILAVTLGWAILPRATVSVGEPAVNLRLTYNKMAVELIKEHPFGVGIGNQALHSVKNGVYKEFGLDKVWQWQPIHNVYLLMASEMGVAGLIAFLVFIAFLFFKNSKFEARNSKQTPNIKIQNSKRFLFWKFGHSNLFRISNLEFRISAAMLVALLLMAAADHFFWTIEQGRLMLWLTIGLVLASGNKEHPGIDSL